MVADWIEQRVRWGERELNALGRLKGWCQAMARGDVAVLAAFDAVKVCDRLHDALEAVKQLCGTCDGADRPVRDPAPRLAGA